MTHGQRGHLGCVFILSFLLFGIALDVHATEYVHTVQEGETLADLAKTYYGSPWKSVYLRTRNSLGNEEPATGAQLVIPAAYTYRVRSGDSPTNIAKRFLGNIDRYTALMSENGLRRTASLSVGAELVLPFHLRHTIASGEDYAQIARLYYRNSKKADFIKDYNGGKTIPKPGSQVTVPIFDRAALNPQQKKPAPHNPGIAAAKVPETTAKAETTVATADISPKEQPTEPMPTKQVAPKEEVPSLTPPEALAVGKMSVNERRQLLTQALEVYQYGNLSAACATLDTLLGQPGFGANERLLLLEYLGYCAVAAGDRNASRDYFTKWLEIDPKVQLNPITTSPKILDVFFEVQEQRTKGTLPKAMSR